eukprot:3660098-Rhodomonas_salina.1
MGLALCKAVPGMQEFAKDLQLCVGQRWLSGPGMTSAKQVPTPLSPASFLRLYRAPSCSLPL